MVYEIRMPNPGEEADEAAILSWTVKEGDPVKEGDVLCEIEAGKTVEQVAAPGSGVLRVVLQETGVLVEPGTLLAVVADPSDDISGYEAE